MNPEITSTKNPRIKNLAALQKSGERKKQGVFVIEGIREISLAQQGGFEITTLFLCEDIYKADKEYPVKIFPAPGTITVNREVFNKIAYRENAGGIVAIAKTKPATLDGLPKVKNPLYLILEKVEKPGNIGAMLRTADAAGIDGVIICDPATDFYNPNVVRSGIGCLFTVPVAAASNEETLKWLKEKKVRIYASDLTASANYEAFDYTEPSALLLGSESHGLSDFWLENAHDRIIIPMNGKIDSLNVSNAAAILVFEALRQRRANR